MYQIIIVFQVLVGLGVIGLVLMQHGKGADAGAAFGSGASGTVFGAQGSASFLSRATAILALFFFASSLALAVLVGHRDESKDLMDVPEAVQNQADVPLVGGSDVPMSVPSISQQQASQEVPVAVEEIDVIEEIPATVESANIVDEKSSALETIELIEKAPSVAEQANNKMQSVQEGVPAVIVEEQPDTQ